MRWAIALASLAACVESRPPRNHEPVDAAAIDVVGGAICSGAGWIAGTVSGDPDLPGALAEGVVGVSFHHYCGDSCDVWGSATVDPAGSYQYQGVPGYDYIVVLGSANSDRWRITPDPRQVGISASASGCVIQDFSVDVARVETHYYTVSGTVSGYHASGSYDDYRVYLSDGHGYARSVFANADGTYAFENVFDNVAYEVSMWARPEVTFAPFIRDVTVSGGDVTGQNFVASLNTNTISGSLVGCETKTVYVNLLACISSTPSGYCKSPWTTSVQTSNSQTPDGYLLQNVGNGTFKVTPSVSGNIDPPFRFVEVAGASVTGQDFTCLP